MSEHAPTPHSRQLGHEEVGLNVRRIIFWTIGLGVLIAGSLAITALLLGAFTESRPAKKFTPAKTASEQRVRGAPLNPYQVSQKRRYLAKQDELLSSYGWIDRQSGIARIPVERAMQIYVERHSEERE